MTNKKATVLGLVGFSPPLDIIYMDENTEKSNRRPCDQSPARGRVLSAPLQGCFAKTGANDDLHWLWFGMVG
jgi:hypothetical protein